MRYGAGWALHTSDCRCGRLCLATARGAAIGHQVVDILLPVLRYKGQNSRAASETKRLTYTLFELNDTGAF